MALDILVVLEGKFEHFLTRCALSLCRLLPVLLVHIEARISLSCRRCDITIIFMDTLNVFLILLRLFLLIGPQSLNFRLEFILTLPEITYL